MLGSVLLDCCRRKEVTGCWDHPSRGGHYGSSQLIEKFNIIQPTHIVNCAAYTDVDGAEKNPAIAYAVNAEGAANVAQVAKNSGARLIHVSTDYVFNGKGSQPYLEEDPCDPANTYGRSKREGEIKVLEFCPRHVFFAHPGCLVLRVKILFLLS